MDPLSIASAAGGLAFGVAGAIKAIGSFICDVRGARKDMDGVSRELMSIQLCLEAIEGDGRKRGIIYSTGVEDQLRQILLNIETNVEQIKDVLRKLSSGKLGRRIQWAATEREDMDQLRSSLESNKMALEIALTMGTITILIQQKKAFISQDKQLESIQQGTASISITTSRIDRKLDVLTGLQRDTSHFENIRLEVSELRTQLSGLSNLGAKSQTLQVYVNQTRLHAQGVLEPLREKDNRVAQLQSKLDDVKGLHAFVLNERDARNVDMQKSLEETRRAHATEVHRLESVIQQMSYKLADARRETATALAERDVIKARADEDADGLLLELQTTTKQQQDTIDQQLRQNNSFAAELAILREVHKEEQMVMERKLKSPHALSQRLAYECEALRADRDKILEVLSAQEDKLSAELMSLESKHAVKLDHERKNTMYWSKLYQEAQSKVSNQEGEAKKSPELSPTSSKLGRTFRKASKEEKKLETFPVPIATGRMRYGTKAIRPTEITVLQNDPIHVLHFTSADWWRVWSLRNGTVGLVPSSYVEMFKSDAEQATTSTLERPSQETPKRDKPRSYLSGQTEYDDPILKRLTSMGWRRDESIEALEKFDYNIDKAADYLTFRPDNRLS